MARLPASWYARPIAHRGLHDEALGLVENSTGAVEAAITAGYGIEIDVQCAGDFRPVVFHDERLDRLTGETGTIFSRDSAVLCRIPYTNGADRICSLDELLLIVAGRAPLFIEVKSRRPEADRERRFEANIAACLQAYGGPAAVMSFDPHCLAAFRALAPDVPRGLIAERLADASHWPDLSPLRRFAMRHLLSAAIARPDFIAYDIRGLPAPAPRLARALGLPLLTWTVRTPEDRDKAARYADAMIFEGFRPA